MGKTYRKNDFCGWTKRDSDKIAKRKANRAFRKHNNQVSSEDAYYYNMDECSSIYDFPKDGKQYFGNIRDEGYKQKLRRK